MHCQRFDVTHEGLLEEGVGGVPPDLGWGLGRICGAVRAWAPEGTRKQRLRKGWTERMDPAVLVSGNKVGKDTKKGSTDVPGLRPTFPGHF